MSELYRIDEINLDRSYEYSVINTNPISENKANSNYYYNSNSSSKTNNENNYIKTTNLDLNITDSSNGEDNYNAETSFTKLNFKKSSSSKAYTNHNPYGDNLLSSTPNQLDKDQLCQKSYFEKLPPEIEISVNGTETLPENSVVEAENTLYTSGTETDTTDMNVKRNIKKTRYFGLNYLKNH